MQSVETIHLYSGKRKRDSLSNYYEIEVYCMSQTNQTLELPPVFWQSNYLKIILGDCYFIYSTINMFLNQQNTTDILASIYSIWWFPNSPNLNTDFNVKVCLRGKPIQRETFVSCVVGKYWSVIRLVQKAESFTKICTGWLFHVIQVKELFEKKSPDGMG